jgi:prolyl-tRNA synthetase
VAVLVRGDHEANPEKVTRLLDGAHNEMADEATVVELTGAAVGFAGPVDLFGKVSKVYIDHAVAAMAVGAAGANKTDYHITNVVPGRDFPLAGDNIQVVDIRNAVAGDTYEGKMLLFKRGIEVGQVFKLLRHRHQPHYCLGRRERPRRQRDDPADFDCAVGSDCHARRQGRRDRRSGGENLPAVAGCGRGSAD